MPHAGDKLGALSTMQLPEGVYEPRQ